MGPTLQKFLQVEWEFGIQKYVQKYTTHTLQGLHGFKSAKDILIWSI